MAPTWLRRSRRSAAAALGAAVAGAVLLAGCGSPAASKTTSPTSTTTSTSTSSATTSTSSTTTTTLPRPRRVPGSGAGSGGVSFGAVERIPVVPVPEGQLLAPPAPTGSPQASSAVLIGFHQVGSGPDLLLIMGEHGSMSWWDPRFIDDLSQHYRVTFFDLPGVGYSEPDPAATTVESLADLTAGLVDELGLTQPVVLGWGLGGEVALALAERHPGLVSRLVLADTTAGGPSAQPPSPAVSRLLASPSATLVELSRLLFPTGAAAARTGWLERLAEVAPDDVTAPAVRREATIQAAFYAHDRQVAEQLATISVPVLVVDGGQDEVVPAANTSLLVEGLAHVRQLVLAADGYAAIFQDEPRVVAAIEAFTG